MTKEQIEAVRSYLMDLECPIPEADANEVCDLALKALEIRRRYDPPMWQPTWQSTPIAPACWNEIACSMHKCRDLGCAVMRDRSTD